MDHLEPPAEPPAMTIACDECVMRRSVMCRDCVVTYFVARDQPDDPLVLDRREGEAVRLLVRAGLVPALRHRVAG